MWDQNIEDGPDCITPFYFGVIIIMFLSLIYLCFISYSVLASPFTPNILSYNIEMVLDRCENWKLSTSGFSVVIIILTASHFCVPWWLLIIFIPFPGNVIYQNTDLDNDICFFTFPLTISEPFFCFFVPHIFVIKTFPLVTFSSVQESRIFSADNILLQGIYLSSFFFLA